MKTHPLAGKLKSSCDAVTSTTLLEGTRETALGAAKSLRHNTDGGAGVSQTRTTSEGLRCLWGGTVRTPATAAPLQIGPLAQTNCQAMGEGSPENSFAPPSQVKGKPFSRTRPTEALPDPWWQWDLGTSSINTLLFNLMLWGWTYPHQSLYHRTLT